MYKLLLMILDAFKKNKEELMFGINAMQVRCRKTDQIRQQGVFCTRRKDSHFQERGRTFCMYDESNSLGFRMRSGLIILLLLLVSHAAQAGTPKYVVTEGEDTITVYNSSNESLWTAHDDEVEIIYRKTATVAQIEAFENRYGFLVRNDIIIARRADDIQSIIQYPVRYGSKNGPGVKNLLHTKHIDDPDDIVEYVRLVFRKCHRLFFYNNSLSIKFKPETPQNVRREILDKYDVPYNKEYYDIHDMPDGLYPDTRSKNIFELVELANAMNEEPAFMRISISESFGDTKNNIYCPTEDR